MPLIPATFCGYGFFPAIVICLNYVLADFNDFDFIRYGTTQAYEALYSVPSKFNVFGSNMFDVSTPYEAFATDLVPIKFTILREHDKILNLSIPYLSTIVFTLVSVKTFKI